MDRATGAFGDIVDTFAQKPISAVSVGLVTDQSR
jgi:hypothetical protein